MKKLNKIVNKILEERYQKNLSEGAFDQLGKALIRGVESAFGAGAETAAKQAAKQTEKQVAKTITISAEEQAAKAKALQDLLHPPTYPLAVVGKQAEKATAKALSTDVQQSIKDLVGKGLSDSEAVAQVLEKHGIKDAEQMQQVIDTVVKSKTEKAIAVVTPEEKAIVKATEKVAPETDKKAIVKAVTDVESKTIPKTEPETKLKTLTKTDTDVKTITKTEPETKTITKTEPETKTVTKTEPETKTLTKTETETAKQTETEPEVKKPTPPPKEPVKGTKFKFPRFIPFVGGGTKKETELGVFTPSGQAARADLGLGAEQLGRYSTLYRQR